MTAALFLVGMAAAWGQGSLGSLSGRVTDDRGEPMHRATVLILGTTRGVLTDADGRYTIAGVPAGTYSVKVSYAGRTPAISEGVVIRMDQSTTLNASLGLKTVNVDVVADRRLTEPGSRVVKDGDEIRKGSRAGTIFGSVLIGAGVGSQGGGVASRLSRDNENAIRIEGTDITDPFYGGTGTIGLALYPTVSSLALNSAEMVKSDVGAEQGNVLGGSFNASLRTGRNDGYDGAFRFRTNSSLLNGSSGPITVAKVGSDGDTTLPAVEFVSSDNRQYDVAVGGPVPGVDRLTFFLSGRLSTTGRTGGYRVYDIDPAYAAARRGVATEAWGFALEPADLSDIPHNASMVRNLQGKLSLQLDSGSALEVGAEVGLTTVEYGGWGNLYMRDHPVFYTRNGAGDIVDSTLDRSLLERDMQQVNQNTLINRAQITYRHFINAGSYFDVTGSYTRHRTEIGKKNEARDYGIFDAYEIYAPEDADNNQVIDRYDLPSRTFRSNPYQQEATIGYGRNPITGLYEGGNVGGASRNPYGLIDMTFPVHGNARNLEQRAADEIRLKGNYEVNLRPADDLEAQLRAGFEIASTTLRRHQNNLPWDPNPFFDVYGYGSTYFAGDTSGRLLEYFSQPYAPLEGGIYLQSRITYRNGVRLTPGVRLDFLKPNANRPPVRRNSLDDILAQLDSLGDAAIKYQISPRIGVSYPITETSQLRVNFSMLYQMPEYNILYDNALNAAERGNQLFGNPDIAPQKALVYEIGYSSRIGRDYELDLSAYYRDIYNQSGVTYVPAVPSPYVIYSVTEYGNVRGLEVTARRVLSDNIGAEINYALQRGVGTASNPTANYATAIAGIDPYTGERQKLPLAEYPLNYDQTHTFSGTVRLSWGDGEGPALAGVRLFERSDLTLTGVFGSGLPYTKENARGEQVSEFNALRLPSTFLLDGHIEKGFAMKDLLGEGAGDLELTLFADVYNILNATGPVGVRLSRVVGGSRFSISGSPDTDGQAMERQSGDFLATPFYRDIDPARPETWDARQYDDFGGRYYNPYADSNLDGVVTQAERFEAYQRYVATIQALRATYQTPRTAAFGVRITF